MGNKRDIYETTNRYINNVLGTLRIKTENNSRFE